MTAKRRRVARTTKIAVIILFAATGLACGGVSPTSKQAATKAQSQVASQPIAPAPPTEARTRWINTSYKSTISHVAGPVWQETDDATGKVHWQLVETGRTADYVELYLAERNQQWRIYASRAEFLKNGKWEWISNGHWDSSAPSVAKVEAPRTDEPRIESLGYGATVATGPTEPDNGEAAEKLKDAVENDANGQNLEPDLARVAKEYVDATYKESQETILKLEAAAKEARRDPKRKASVEATLKDIKERREKGIFHPHVGVFPFREPPKMGVAGKISRIKVLQVIDANNAIAEFVWMVHGSRIVTLRGGGYAPTPIIDEKEETVWLVMPTVGIVDDAIADVNRVFAVTGTKTYHNVLRSSKTVFVLHALDDATIKQAYEDILKKEILE